MNDYKPPSECSREFLRVCNKALNFLKWNYSVDKSYSAHDIKNAILLSDINLMMNACNPNVLRALQAWGKIEKLPMVDQYRSLESGTAEEISEKRLKLCAKYLRKKCDLEAFFLRDMSLLENRCNEIATRILPMSPDCIKVTIGRDFQGHPFFRIRLAEWPHINPFTEDF